MIVTRVFSTRMARDEEYQRLKKLGTKHLYKRTDSVVEKITEADGKIKIRGKMTWILAFPVQ